MECIGKLCPERFQAINTPGFVQRVVLMPYLYRDGEVKIMVDDGFHFLEFDCDKEEAPFSCAEKRFRDVPISSEKVTHTIITGHKDPQTMYIFVEISSRDKNLYLLAKEHLFHKRMEIADAYHDIKKIIEELTSGTPLRRVKLGKEIYGGLRYKKLDAKNMEEIVKFGDRIGKGAYGEVYKGILLQDIVAPDGSIIKKGSEVAVKSQELKKSALIERELFSLYKAMIEKCPNLVQIYDVLYDFNEQVYYIIMEYVEGKDIQRLIQTKNRDFQKYLQNEDLFINTILWPLIEAVDCLHKHDIAHRDIKGGNILFDEKNKRIVLIDLGLSCFIPKCSGRAGTGYTMYPLYFRRGIDYNKIDKKTADLWSIGTTVYQIFNNYKAYPLNITLHYFYQDQMDDMVKTTLQDWKGKIEYGMIPEDYKVVREIFKGFTTLPMFL